MEAVKQDSAAIGLRSKTDVVPACVNKANSELSSRRNRLKKISEVLRNQYHTDVTTWPPPGGLFQVEYAMEAVKQGSAAIGLRSKTDVVPACVNKANSELSSRRNRLKKISEVLRNQYHTDVTTWPPPGGLFQVEYAMEAFKQGSTAIGLRSKTDVVPACVNKANSELSSRRNRLKKISEVLRNQYHTDVTTWPPPGGLFQVEYAMEAVKQGSAAIGLRSKTDVVPACVNKANSELSSRRNRLKKISEVLRNQYHTDVTTWPPPGGLFQVEYAMEAVKQGSAAIGLRSKTDVVPACVNKANSELSSRRNRLKKISEVLRNQYHTDVTTWPPPGGLFQVEYAMEAFKQGSTAIGLRSKTDVVPACVNKAELSSRQKKISEMLRNQYHTDVTTWSPAGGLFQVEYAMEAFKQGSAAIGLRSKTHVVLVCVNKANSELYSHQTKIFKIDDHIGVAIAGHGRVLSRYMRSECINYNYTYESPLPVGRLVVQLANKAQVCTQRSWKRPYGVGLLVAGLDESVAHLYYNCPSGNYFEHKFNNFTASSREDLIKDALIATRESLQGEKLRSSVCTIAVVGVGEPFHILDQESVQQLIDTFEIVSEEEAAPAEPCIDRLLTT